MNISNPLPSIKKILETGLEIIIYTSPVGVISIEAINQEASLFHVQTCDNVYVPKWESKTLLWKDMDGEMDVISIIKNLEPDACIEIGS
jgi:hypothetical protein